MDKVGSLLSMTHSFIEEVVNVNQLINLQRIIVGISTKQQEEGGQPCCGKGFVKDPTQVRTFRLILK